MKPLVVTAKRQCTRTIPIPCGRRLLQIAKTEGLLLDYAIHIHLTPYRGFIPFHPYYTIGKLCLEKPRNHALAAKTEGEAEGILNVGEFRGGAVVLEPGEGTAELHRCARADRHGSLRSDPGH